MSYENRTWDNIEWGCVDVEVWIDGDRMCGCCCCFLWGLLTWGRGVQKESNLEDTHIQRRSRHNLPAEQSSAFHQSYSIVFKPTVLAEATVSALSAALLTAMMKCVVKCAWVCTLQWIESATSAGRRDDNVAVQPEKEQAAVREREVGTWRKLESEVWVGENHVGRQSNFSVGYEETRVKMSDYTLSYEQPVSKHEDTFLTGVERHLHWLFTKIESLAFNFLVTCVALKQRALKKIYTVPLRHRTLLKHADQSSYLNQYSLFHCSPINSHWNRLI